MICNTPYPDRNKRIVIIDRLERLCIQCGGFCELRPADGTRACLRCGGTQYVECYESDAAEWRAEIEKAQELAEALQPQMDYFLDGIEIALDAPANQVALINRYLLDKGATR